MTVQNRLTSTIHSISISFTILWIHVKISCNCIGSFEFTDIKILKILKYQEIYQNIIEDRIQNCFQLWYHL